MQFRNSSYFFCFIFAAIYVICTLKSNGYHHPDEHFQIIEFAGLKAKWNVESDLAWEYDSRIRPSLQPYLALSIFRLASLFEIIDPFILATFLRCTTAIFSIAAILIFIYCFKTTIKEKYHIAFILLSFFLWFLPSLNVRFSSETWAGLCLLISVGLIQLNKNKVSYNFLIGVLFGLSFEFRFQMGLAILGIVVWIMLFDKNYLTKIVYIFLGGLITVVLCTMLDYFFYGEFVFPPYNYFHVNIINNVSSAYGTAPWFVYLMMILIAPTYLIGTAILLAIIVLLVYDYKSIILWAILPFIFFHSLIPHKELRFIFPLVNFVPILTIYAFQLININVKKNKVTKLFSNSILLVIILVNLGGLVMMMFKPAGNGSINLIHYISKKYVNTTPLTIFCLKNNNPYIIGYEKGLKLNFYLPKNLVLKNIKLRTLRNPDPQQIYILPKSYYKERQMLEKSNYKIEYAGIPAWIIKMNRFYRVFDEDFVPLLYTQKK